MEDSYQVLHKFRLSEVMMEVVGERMEVYEEEGESSAEVVMVLSLVGMVEGKVVVMVRSLVDMVEGKVVEV